MAAAPNGPAVIPGAPAVKAATINNDAAKLDPMVRVNKKFVDPFKNMFSIYMLLKVVRAGTLVLSASAAYSNMSSLYFDNVLVSGNDPPKLANQLTNFIIMDMVFTVISCAGAYMLVPDKEGIWAFVLDYLFSVLMTYIVLVYIADIMYNKKFFLYKDDGLRAIRAFKLISLVVAQVLNWMPAGAAYYYARSGNEETICKTCNNTYVSETCLQAAKDALRAENKGSSGFTKIGDKSTGARRLVDKIKFRR